MCPNEVYEHYASFFIHQELNQKFQIKGINDLI